MTYKILVVDDDAHSRTELTTWLRADRYQVSTATDAITAMVTARRVDPDLVILDLTLPAGGGFAVLEQLRAHKPSSPVPVIIMTARVPQSNRRRALDAGAVAFLQKPVNHDELLQTVRAHVGKPLAALKKILIVEDDPDTQKGLATLLKAEGFVTSFVADGATALSVAAKEEPSVILLDLGLPAGDGFVVLDRLTNHPTLSGVPVIVVSARDPAVNKPKALHAGAVAFFQKPADFDELLKAIRRAIAPEPAG